MKTFDEYKHEADKRILNDAGICITHCMLNGV